VLHDIIEAGLEAGASDGKIRQAVRTLYPETTDGEFRAAYLQVVDMLEERAARDFAEAEEHRRQAERINHELLAECTEIALETGLALRHDTVLSDFVREAAAMGSGRASALLGRKPTDAQTR